MSHIKFGDAVGRVIHMRRVDISGIAIDVNTGAPLVVLREHDEPHRLLPIFIGAPEATAIAIAATGQHPPRPLVHDLMATMVASLDGRVEVIEVNGLEDGTFFASIRLTGPSGSRELDSRPSDALALAVRTGAPVFVSDAVLDEAGSLPEPDEPEEATLPQLEPAQIDAEVESFRSFLDDIDPSDFETGSGVDDPAAVHADPDEARADQVGEHADVDDVDADDTPQDDINSHDTDRNDTDRNDADDTDRNDAD
jgi:bifunctional DNase/RNase